MKNKILMVFAIMISLLIICTLPSYAAEANVILEKDSSTTNKVKVFVEVSNEQSVTKANIVLNVNAANKENIANTEFNWSTDISSSSETAKWTTNNDKVNLYIISKNELGNEIANGKKIIEIGTLTVNTKNNEETAVDISVAQDGLKLASMDHKIATLTNTDIATSTQLVVNKKEVNPPAGNENNNSTVGGDTSNPTIGNNASNTTTGTNTSNKPSGTTSNRRPSSGTNNSGNQIENDVENNIENNVTNELENQTENNVLKNENKTSNKVTTQSSKEMPDAGEEKSKFPYIIGCIILALIAIFVIYVINKPKKKNRKLYN